MAIYFSDQYVQLNGEDILVPPSVVNSKKTLASHVENNNLYVNGYKYNKEKKTWNKSLYANWLLIDLYTQIQLLASSAFIIFVTMLLFICKVIK